MFIICIYSFSLNEKIKYIFDLYVNIFKDFVADAVKKRLDA